MQLNKKLAFFVVLIIISICVWIPKRRKIKGISAATSSTSFDRGITLVNTVPRERTEFAEWGRNPFVSEKMNEGVDDITDLRLTCIIWSNGEGQALINNSIMRIGDKIEDRTLKQIASNRVVLTDGKKDHVLMLHD